MRWLKVLGIVLGAIWFFPISCTTGALVGTIVISKLDNRVVAEGEVVHSHFKVVVKPNKNATPFRGVSLSSLPSLNGLAGDASFLMSNSSGKLDTGHSYISYQVVEDLGSEQIIEVVESLNDGDGKIWSRYKATQSSVSPISSRMFYFGYMFESIPYALAASFIIFLGGRFIRRKVNTSSE